MDPAAEVFDHLQRRLPKGCAVSVSVLTAHGRFDAWSGRAAGDRGPSFLVYSLTKTVIAVLVMELSHRGYLALDDSISRWFPEIPRSSTMTVRQLLSHTSGIRNYGETGHYLSSVAAAPSAPWTREQFLAPTIAEGLAAEPGAAFAYSNPGYMLLRELCEIVSGRPIGALIGEYIAEPYDLRTVRWIAGRSNLAALAPAESCGLSQNGKPRDVRELYHPGWVSHGVIGSDTVDMARFLYILIGADMKAKPHLRPMLDGVSVDDRRYREPVYGLGLMGFRSEDGAALWGHTGAGPGYSAGAFFRRAEGVPGVSACVLAAREDPELIESSTLMALELAARA